jgi:hypothetical protein
VQTTTAKNVRINGGTYTNNSRTTNNTYNGIEVGVAVSNFSITGAKCGTAFGLTGLQSKGISVEPGASNNYVITNNDLLGNTTALADLGTGLVKNVTGNIGYNPLPATSITVGASPFTFVNSTGSPIQIVYAGGGTITSINVGGILSGSTAIVIVPPGKSVVTTYTVIPTMNYIGVV